MTDTQTIQIGEAKGRPMLHWVGKRPLDQVTAFPAQLVETFNPTGEELPSPDFGGGARGGGLLFHGDNKDVLAWLLAHGYRGKVNLIYIDPPFDSGADYVRRVHLRGVRGTAKLESEAHSLGEQIQYTDIWANDMYLQFIYERLLLLKELLAHNGSIYLHTDWHKGHHLRCLMDEVFGGDSLKNEIVWRYSKYQMRDMSRFVNNHDIIYWYAHGVSPTYNAATEPLNEPKLLKRKKWDKRTSKIVNVRDEDGNLIYDEYHEQKIDDVWAIDIIGATSGERLDYPTQKPVTLVKRIIEVSSHPGDLVLDCFVGSGTTAAVAQKLSRCWIAADINKGAIQTTSKRLQAIIREQIEAGAAPRQGVLDLTGGHNETPQAAALSFSVYRVNNYDLQIQHNEAVKLAVEMIGIERTKTDVFFDGTLGRRLVKIVPFNHPLTPLDLQLLQDEIKARPEEERDIVVVCLGKEIAADSWLEEYNKHRPVNRIEVIELRTDQKYGKFFLHQPAHAEVRIERRDTKIIVEIEDFISPTIVERLEIDTPLFKAQIPDWRAMVDVVLIDAAYDGEVFNIVLSDVPERKKDLVSGRYELPSPEGKTTVAVKIIDMLGEEVLVTAEV